ncbi:MAG TPA: hypothetical protein PK228_01315 [Saprospiraceae bacterium]|nr:hypothetical protein [Saprospiraceae bacterium]
MNTKLLLAALAGGVASFLLGWLVFGILLKPTYDGMMTEAGKNIMRPEAEMMNYMWAMILSNLAYGLLFALIFGRWANISTFRGGAIAGGVISLLLALSFDLGMYSMMNAWQGGMGLVIDPLVNGVVGAVVGGVVGWVLGYGQRQAA